MPAAAVAIPLIASAAGSYFSSKSASTPGAQEQGAAAGQTNAAGQLSSNAATLSGIGGPALGQASKYFQQLAGGNRATMTQALAPQIQATNDVYGGTARTLSRFTRGPTQQVQMAEAERERGGQIGSLFATARPQAASALAGIGSGAFSGANAALGGTGGIFGQQAGQGMQSRFGGAQLGMEAGQGFGGLLFNLLKNYKGGGGGGGFGGGIGAAQD